MIIYNYFYCYTVEEVAGTASTSCIYGMATGHTLRGFKSRSNTEEEGLQIFSRPFETKIGFLTLKFSTPIFLTSLFFQNKSIFKNSGRQNFFKLTLRTTITSFRMIGEEMLGEYRFEITKMAIFGKSLLKLASLL